MSVTPPTSEGGKNLGDLMRARYGADYYRRIGRKGGKATSDSGRNPLFVTINKSGVLTRTRLMGSDIYHRFLYRAKQAGVKRFSPHDARRTWIGNLLSQGEDVATIQQLAGHQSPTTTTRYDRRPKERRKQAIQRLWFPWRDNREEETSE